MVLQVGKRYKCDTCGAEVLVTKPGEGALSCCQQEMGLLQPKTTPSSD
jgi:desulfoferrodoxin-like iron-binding protein